MMIEMTSLNLKKHVCLSVCLHTKPTKLLAGATCLAGTAAPSMPIHSGSELELSISPMSPSRSTNQLGYIYESKPQNKNWKSSSDASSDASGIQILKYFQQRNSIWRCSKTKSTSHAIAVPTRAMCWLIVARKAIQCGNGWLSSAFF